MTIANFSISSDMNVYYHEGDNDYDTVGERASRMGAFSLYVSNRMVEWFEIPQRATPWVEVDHNGRIEVGGKYRFDVNDLNGMNLILLSVMEAAGRHARVVTYGDIKFFEDQDGWEMRK